MASTPPIPRPPEDLLRPAREAYAGALNRLYELLAGDGVVAVLGGIDPDELAVLDEFVSPPSKRCVVGRVLPGGEAEALGPVRELDFDLVYVAEEGRWWWTIAVD